MGLTLDPLAPLNSHGEIDSFLRVVVVYEDLAAGLRAHRLFERTSRGLQAMERGEIRCAMWKIGGPFWPMRIKKAAEQAITADIIVIAVNERSATPELLQEWIELWLPKKIGQCGLVALLDHRAGNYEHRGVYRYLKEVAHIGSLSFFADGREKNSEEISQMNFTDDVDFELDSPSATQSASRVNAYTRGRHRYYLGG